MQFALTIPVNLRLNSSISKEMVFRAHCVRGKSAQLPRPCLAAFILLTANLGEVRGFGEAERRRREPNRGAESRRRRRRGVGCGERVSPSSLGKGLGERVVPPPRIFFRILVSK